VPCCNTRSHSIPFESDSELARQLADLQLEGRPCGLRNGGVVVVATWRRASLRAMHSRPSIWSLSARRGRRRPRDSRTLARCSSGSGRQRFWGLRRGPQSRPSDGGYGRSKGGLSVYTFLRVRTWLRIETPRRRVRSSRMRRGRSSRGLERTLVRERGWMSVRADCDTFHGIPSRAPMASSPATARSSHSSDNTRHSAPRKRPTRRHWWRSPANRRAEAGAMMFQEGRQRRGRHLRMLAAVTTMWDCCRGAEKPKP